MKPQSETTNTDTIEDLIAWLAGGAVIGIVIAFVLGPVCWLLPSIGGIPSAMLWLSPGALISASCAFYLLRRKKEIPQKVIQYTGYILLVLGVIILDFLLASHLKSQAVAAQYTKFYEYYNNNEYEKAYDLMSPTYRQTHSLGGFRSDYKFSECLYDEIDSDYTVTFLGNRVELWPSGKWWLIGVVGSGSKIELEKEKGVWYLTGECAWYLD